MAFTYRYFADPHAFSDDVAEPRPCSLCHRELPGYEGPFYGPLDLPFVCEPCLFSGALHSVGCIANEGHISEVRGGIALADRTLSQDAVRALATQRTTEVEERTPRPLAWQDHFWPVHRSDYCRFEKEAGRADFERLSRGLDAQHYFTTHLHPDFRGTDLQSLWESMRPDSPSDHSEAYDIGVYLYTCLVCGEHLVTWDAS